MGSFDFTCAISQIPIRSGDELRLMLLTQSPYHQKAGVSVHVYDRWFPRAPPLRGVYEDSGSPRPTDRRHADWTGIAGDVWRKGFKVDLVEKGVGDNQYHDSATKQEMTIDDYLTACYEDRLRVKRESSPFNYKEWLRKMGKEEPKVPEGIPTMQRVEEAIASLNTGKHFFVDGELYGEVRVRVSEYEERELTLSIVQAALAPKYATMIAAGTSGYDVELLVRPRPGTEGFHGYRSVEPKDALAVGYGLIREDVWQAVLTLEPEDWRHRRWSLSAYKEQIHALYELSQKEDDPFFRSQLMLESKAYDEFPLVASVVKDPVPFTVGVGTAFEIVRNHGHKYPEAEVKAWLDDLAEFACVQDNLSKLWFQWKPSTYAGQTSEAKDYSKLHYKLAAVAGRIHKADMKERRDW